MAQSKLNDAQVMALEYFQRMDAHCRTLDPGIDGYFRRGSLHLKTIETLVEKGLLEQKPYNSQEPSEWRITDDGRYTLATHKELKHG